MPAGMNVHLSSAWTVQQMFPHCTFKRLPALSRHTVNFTILFPETTVLRKDRNGDDLKNGTKNFDQIWKKNCRNYNSKISKDGAFKKILVIITLRKARNQSGLIIRKEFGKYYLRRMTLTSGRFGARMIRKLRRTITTSGNCSWRMVRSLWRTIWTSGRCSWRQVRNMRSNNWTSGRFSWRLQEFCEERSELVGGTPKHW